MTAKRILLVEDEAITAWDEKEVLEGLGYLVTAVVNSGEEALRSIEGSPPDLVLMDIMLGAGMDGIEAADRIRREHGLPVVYVTAHADAHFIERAKLTEPFGYVIKPFDQQSLASNIEVALYKHSIDRRLEQSEERFRSIFEHAPMGIALAEGEDGRIVSCNPCMTDLVGYSAEELCAMSFKDFTHPEDVEKDVAKYAALLAGELSHYSLEKRYLRKGGSEVWVYLTVSAIHDEVGMPRYAVGMVEDITERKRAEEALRHLNEELELRVARRTADLARSNENYRHTLEKLERAQSDLVRSEKLAGLGSLVAGVAHELNTPLGVGVTLASTLADRLAELKSTAPGEEPDRDKLGRVIAMASEASDLLTRSLLKASELIRNFKQVAVDQTSAQRRNFELDDVVQEVVATLLPQFKGSAHQLKVAIPDAIPMDSFPGPLGQIITNLVNNALIHAFAEDTAGEVRISATLGDENWVRLTVEDNGKGVLPNDVERIFDPFFTTRRSQGGSGLGLHIVYNLATRVLGGRINVRNKPGEGTRFVLDMPCRAPLGVEHREIIEL